MEKNRTNKKQIKFNVPSMFSFFGQRVSFIIWPSKRDFIKIVYSNKILSIMIIDYKLLKQDVVCMKIFKMICIFINWGCDPSKVIKSILERIYHFHKFYCGFLVKFWVLLCGMHKETTHWFPILSTSFNLKEKKTQILI